MYETEEFVFRPFVWRQVPVSAVGPAPRSGHRVVTDGIHLYSFGGFNPKPGVNTSITKPLFRELWSFNLARRRWRQVSVHNVPDVLVSNSVVLQGTLLIVFGGTGVPFGSSNSNDVYICDLSRMPLRFDFVPGSGAMPEPRYGQALHVAGRYCYAIGGTNGYVYSSDVHRLDLTTMEWDEYYICRGIPGEPEARYRHEIAVKDNKIYVFGGGTTDESFGFERIPTFDIERRMWTSVATIGEGSTLRQYPAPRRFHSSVRIPGSDDVLIIGGVSRNKALRDTWKINLTTLKWTRLTRMMLPQATSFHSSAITPVGKVYTFGGVVHRHGSQTEHMDRVATVLQAWATIPKLKEICWEAICHYGIPHDHHDPLLESLPNEFKRRIQQPQWW